MITSVEIQNFQSHPDTKVDFTSGLNVLTGSSRSGKSTIRRAIMWVITNRPSGNGIVSWWAKKNDKLIGETKVTVTLDNGTVISRVKSDKLNGYIINGKTLEAVATGVPDEITEAFNMSDINMSGQFDAPFLISQSAGYVAQYLNGIINLEDADYFQSEVESRRRKCVQEAEATNKKIVELSETIKGFDWLDPAEALIERIKRRDSKINAGYDKISKIKLLVASRKDAQEILTDMENLIPLASNLVRGVNDRSSQLQALRKRTEQIRVLIVERNKAKEITTIPVADMDALAKRISNTLRIIAEKKATIRTIQKQNDTYQEATISFTDSTRELKKTQRELDLVEICPFCGSKRRDIGATF